MRQAGRQRGVQKARHTDQNNTGRQTDHETGRQAGRQRGVQKARHTGESYTGRQTDR